jgi:hypothetical protein
MNICLVCLGVVIKSGDKRVFLEGIFWVFLRRCEKNRGSIFLLGEFIYVDVDINYRSIFCRSVDFPYLDI